MLHLVATPIGNLKDISLRALEVLRSADVIACEDTRRTGILLKHYGVSRGEVSSSIRGGATPPLVSFHDHSGPGRVREIVSLLKEGKSVALVTDGGTPLISDPGFLLLREAIREGIPVETLPGASAVTTALVASGLPAETFSFLGFLPAKPAARKKALQRISEREETLIFFESPYRLSALLKDLVEILGEREAAVCRELTKKFEEINRGTLNSLNEAWSQRKPLGEFVVVVSGKGRKRVFE